MENNKPAILIVSSWYPSKDNPTEGSFVHEQVQMLQKNGHLVTVIKPNLNGSFKDTFKGKTLKDKNYHFENVPVFEVNTNVYLPKLKFTYYKILQKKIAKTISQNKIYFDLVHSHALLSAGIVAPFIAVKFSKPLIHTEHTSGLIFAPNQFDKTDQKAISKIIEIADKILFVSQYAKENSLIYKDHISPKLSVLHNVVSPLFFKSKELLKKEEILVIGDFIDRKNHSFILEAWIKFLEITDEKQGKYNLVFSGAGFESEEFKNLSKGIRNLKTTKRLNREEVVRKISESNVLLSASKLETFGLTIAEALALGVPVVVLDSGGPRDIVDEGDGFIVDTNSTLDFATKIKEVLEGNHDDANIIRERCKQKFSEEVIYTKLIKTYQDSIN